MEFVRDTIVKIFENEPGVIVISERRKPSISRRQYQKSVGTEPTERMSLDIPFYRTFFMTARGCRRVGLCGRVRLLTARGLRQRLDCGVCPVPCCFEIAAIERDQRACDFEDRVRLIRQRLTAGFRKPRCQSADRVELADQHSGCRRGGLTNLIERELDKALDAHRPHPYPELATGVVPVSLKRGPLGEREQRVGEPVDAGNARERIVDRR